MNKLTLNFLSKYDEIQYLKKNFLFSKKLVVLLILKLICILLFSIINDPDNINYKLYYIILFVFLGILSISCPKLINSILFFLSIFTSTLVVFRLFDALHEKYNGNNKYFFLIGLVFSWILHISFCNNNFLFSILSILFSSIIFYNYIYINPLLNAIVLIIQASQMIIFYTFQRTKKELFLISQKELEQALEWKELLFELNPDSVTAIFEKDLTNNEKHKKKNSNKFFEISKSKNLKIFRLFGKLLEINKTGIEKYGINSSKDFQNFLENIKIDKEVELRIIDSSLNLLSFQKVRKIYTCNGIYKYEEKIEEERIKISIHEILWNKKSCYLFRMETKLLEEELGKLKELNQYKDQILSSVSHDLRTPLNGINFVLEQIENLSKNEEILKNVNWAKANSDLLLYLINDILDYSQIKMNKLKIVITSFQLKKAIDEVFILMNITASMKNISLKLSFLMKEDIIIQSDERRIKQVLINLIGNSLKFTNYGFVELKVSEDGSHYIKFEVIDTGIGINSEIIPKLTEPFATFDTTNGLNKNGIGNYLFK